MELNYKPSTILRETQEYINVELGDALNHITLERIVIGLFFTGVKLSNGVGGICFTPIKTIPEAVCCLSPAKAMPCSGKLVGTPVSELLDAMYNGNYLRKAIGIATLNALSQTCWDKNPPKEYEILLYKRHYVPKLGNAPSLCSAA
jgi:uncharacterized protein (DUF4213/DUF364 family)